MDSSISNVNAYSLYNSQCCTFYTDSNPVPINSSEWKHHMSQFVSTSEYCLYYSIQPWMCIFICMLMQSMNDWKCIEALYKYYSGRTLTCRITSHHNTHFQSIQLKANQTHTRDVHRFVKHNHKFRGAKLPFVWIFLWQMPKSSFLCIKHSSISNFRLFYFFRLFCFFFWMFSFFRLFCLFRTFCFFCLFCLFKKVFCHIMRNFAWGHFSAYCFFFCYLKNLFFSWRTKWKICGWL